MRENGGVFSTSASGSPKPLTGWSTSISSRQLGAPENSIEQFRNFLGHGSGQFDRSVHRVPPCLVDREVLLDVGSFRRGCGLAWPASRGRDTVNSKYPLRLRRGIGQLRRALRR